MTDPLPADIAEAVDAASARLGPIGQRLIYHHTVASTNDEALALLVAGAEEWTTVLAGAQTTGRGRRGRRWFSVADVGLYFSTILRGVELSRVTLMAGVAVAEGIRGATGLDVEIKWPNDIILPSTGPWRRRAVLKVAGILAETSSNRHPADGVVLGIGVNVSETTYPIELRSIASSLAGARGGPVSRATVFVEVLTALARWHRILSEGRTAEILERWSTLAPMSEGTTVAWSDKTGQRIGVTAGVDADGALRVRGPLGVERLVAGEVTVRSGTLGSPV